MMWWKGPPRIRLGDTAVGLLVVGLLALGGWVVRWLMVNAFTPLAKPWIASKGSEPSRLEQYSQSVLNYLAQHEFWLVGSAFTFLTIHGLWLVAVYLWQWKRSDVHLPHPFDSAQVLEGALFVIVFGTFTLAWIQTSL